MTLKGFLSFCCLLALASQGCCRSIQVERSGFFERNSDVDLVAEATIDIGHSSNQQGRVFPGAVVAKKLLLLKFKTLAPIKLLLLKSENGEEIELVSIYESPLNLSDVEFISTPGGITGHEDVQAIAIPTELANKNTIAQTLQVVTATQESQNVKIPNEEDQPLGINENDEQQILVDAITPSILRSTINGSTVKSSPFEESSLYLYPYQGNRRIKHVRRNQHRYYD